ncbi:MAG: 5-(carboxyamino)imidazole ribonucleotide synthase [Clostridiales bacterium]|jgi:5-(carboxyamino)imidazole ribonucleotide synthase|nr:5-(carboxyamino)imidazole ribonucleotide synthase [Clostridiales bacterium]
MNSALCTKIGIIGGGQLGKMMMLEAKKMGMYVSILDPDPHCPAHSIADHHIVAGLKDREGILKLAELSDILTYEIEHIDVAALFEVEEGGKPVYPTPQSLKIIQDKLTQKQRLMDGGVPAPDFMPVESAGDILTAGEKFGYPMMLKARLGGYDGRGNYLVKSAAQAEEAFSALNGEKIPLMIDKFVNFDMEISVLACRGKDGEIAIYPVAQNEHREEVLYETRVPACIDAAVRDSAMEVARKVMEIFGGVGMFCVEMFVESGGRVLVNEIAPRPHNSGHYTIEGCVASQFENHVRAVCGLPLGDTTLIRPSVMRNILGEPGHSGPAFVQGAENMLKIPGAALHIYGKQETRAGRKMGHITVIDDSLENAVKKAGNAHGSLKIISRR